MEPLSQLSEPVRFLRWRFEYVDKPPKIGAWDDSAPEESAKAYRQSREGLLFAVIEAKDFNGIIYRVFECSGPDFCNFQWEVAAQLNVGGQPGRHRLVGLTLVSRNERATAFHHGMTSVEQRSKDDFDNHYSYGKV